MTRREEDSLWGVAFLAVVSALVILHAIYGDNLFRLEF